MSVVQRRTGKAIAGRPEEKFAEYLRRKRHRNTRARRELVSHIFSYGGHFTAEELVSDVERHGIRVSRATVYRTLTLLVEAGLLRKIRFGDADAYEHDYGIPAHDHLYCTGCGKILEFQVNELDSLLARVARRHRFSISSHRLIVTGLCKDCAKG